MDRYTEEDHTHLRWYIDTRPEVEDLVVSKRRWKWLISGSKGVALWIAAILGAALALHEFGPILAQLFGSSSGVN